MSRLSCLLLRPPRKGFTALPETSLLPFPSAFSASDSGPERRTGIGEEGMVSPALSALPQEEGEAAILTGLEVSGVHPPRSSARFGTSVKDSSCKKEWEKDTCL